MENSYLGNPTQQALQESENLDRQRREAEAEAFFSTPSPSTVKDKRQNKTSRVEQARESKTRNLFGDGYDPYSTIFDAVATGNAEITSDGEINSNHNRTPNTDSDQQAQYMLGQTLGTRTLDLDNKTFLSTGEKYEGRAARFVLGETKDGYQTIRVAPESSSKNIAEDLTVSYDEYLPENEALALRDYLFGREHAQENRAFSFIDQLGLGNAASIDHDTDIVSINIDKVIDGDTVRTTDGRNIRFANIDTPERVYEEGKESETNAENAYQMLESIVNASGGKLYLSQGDPQSGDVRLVDDHGRTLGTAFTPSGKGIDGVMAELGLSTPVNVGGVTRTPVHNMDGVSNNELDPRYDELFTDLLGSTADLGNEPRITDPEYMERKRKELIRPYQFNNPEGGILYQKGLEMDTHEAEMEFNTRTDTTSQRALNIGQEVVAAAGRILYDGLDAITTSTGNVVGRDFSLGTEEEKAFQVNKLVGYNSVYADQAVEEITESVTNLYEDFKDPDKKIDYRDLINGLKAVGTTPELAAGAITDIAVMHKFRLVGAIFLGVANGRKLKNTKDAQNDVKKRRDKGDITEEQATRELQAITDTADATDLFQKGSQFLADNEGMAVYIAGRLNNQISTFTQNNNGDAPSNADIARMLTIETATAFMERGVGLATLKNSSFIGQIKKVMENVPEGRKARLAAAVPRKAAAITAAAGLEAGQEYLQTMGEIFNTQFNTFEGTDSATELFTDKDTQIEALTGALIGGGIGGQIRTGVEGISGVSATARGASEGARKASNAVSNAFPTQAEREARASSTDLQERNKALKASEEQDLALYREAVQAVTSDENFKGSAEEADDAIFYTVNTELDSIFTVDESGALSITDRDAAGKLIQDTQRLSKGMRAAGKNDHADALLGKLAVIFKQINDAEQKASEKNKQSNDQIYGSDKAFVDFVSELGRSQSVINEDVQQSLVEIGQGYESLDFSIEDVRKLIDLGAKEQAVRASEWSKTGKSRTDVSDEAQEGPRGLLSYYRDAVIAKIQKDDTARDTALKNLTRFSRERQNKLKALDAKLADVQRSVDAEIQAQINTLSDGSEPTPAIVNQARRDIADKYDTYNNPKYRTGKAKKSEAVETVKFGNSTFDIRKYNVAMREGGVYRVRENLMQEAKAGADLETAAYSSSARLEDVDLGQENVNRTESPEEIDFNDNASSSSKSTTPSEDINISIGNLANILNNSSVEYVQNVYDALRENESMFDPETVGTTDSDRRQSTIEYLFDTYDIDQIATAIDYVENEVYADSTLDSGELAALDIASQQQTQIDTEDTQNYSDAYYVDDSLFSYNENEINSAQKKITRKEASELAKQVQAKRTEIKKYKDQLEDTLNELNRQVGTHVTVNDIRSTEDRKMPTAPLFKSVEILLNYINRKNTIVYKGMSESQRNEINRSVRHIKEMLEGC